MTNREKEIMEVFGKLVPMLTEEEKHDLLVSGKALTLLKASQPQQPEPPKQAS